MQVNSIHDLASAIKSQEMGSILNMNKYLRDNPNLIQKIKNGELTSSNYSHYQDHQKLFNRNEFSWEKEQASVYKLRTLIQMKNLTVKNNETYLPWTLADASFYQELFPLHLIEEYLSRPNFLIGTPIYDQALRLQCDLLQVLLLFHLKHDFRFHCKISAEKYNLLDPFTRVKIRENNTNSEIYKKYFNDTFNLKKFIFDLYKNYFPNVTWRYIGGGHFAHRITIQITEYLYQLGLWTYEDNEKLIRIMLEKSENLLVLENASIKDAKNGKIRENFINELSHVFSDIKEYLSLIILHSIIIVNDESFKESLSWKRESKGVFKDSYKRLWENVYHKDRELNNLLNTVMMKFLLRQSEGLKEGSKEEKMKALNKKTKKRIDDFFMIMSDDQSDIFSKGNELVTEDLLDYHLGNFKMNIKDRARRSSQTPQTVKGFQDLPVPNEKNFNVSHMEKKLTNKKNFENFKEEAYEIKMNLVSLIDDIMSGEFGNFDELEKDNNVEKVISHMSQWISTYIQSGTQKTGKIYFRQLALAEFNVPVLILILISIVNNLDKTRSLKLLLSSLTDVCRNNITSQAQLFFNQGFEHFQNLNRTQTLLGAVMTTDIFMKNNTMLYLNQETFENILQVFKHKVKNNKKIFDPNFVKNHAKKSLTVIFALEKFNKYFENFIDVEKLKTQDKGHYYDLVLQKIITKTIVENVIPILSDQSFLKGVNIQKFKLPISKSHMSLNQIMEIIRIPNHSEPILRSYIYDLCVSFIKLFNKATSRLIYGSTFKAMSKYTSSSYYLSQFDYLFNFREGISIRTEVLKYYSNFHYFFNNHLITDRVNFNYAGKVVYLEHMIPEITSSSVICDEFNYIAKVIEAKSKGDEWCKTQVRKYMLEGLLPMIFKCCKGISSTYFINKKIDNSADLPHYKRIIDQIFDKIQENSSLISKLIDITFTKEIETRFKKLGSLLIGQDLGGSNINSERSNLLKPAEMDENLGSRRSQYREVETEKVKFEGKDYGDMDHDEIIYPELYEMRKKAECILFFIERAYPLHMKHILSKFTRVTANKRSGYSKERSIPLEKLEEYYSVKNPQKDFNHKSIEEVLTQNKHFKEFLTTKKMYIKEKEEYLKLKGKQNMMFSFLEDNPDQVGNVLFFIIKSIYDVFKKGEEEKDGDLYMDDSSISLSSGDEELKNFMEEIESAEGEGKKKEKKEIKIENGYITTKFFESKYVYAYIRYLDYLVSEYQEMKWAFFYMLSLKTPKNSQAIFEKGKKFFIHRSLKKKDRNEARKVLSIVYYLFTELGQFCTFKTFHDEDWGIIWDVFFRLSGFIKNLCENNSTYFKRFFTDFIPKLNSNPEFNNYSRNITFESFIRMESINQVKLSWYISEPRLMLADLPETSICSLRYFEVVSEFLNGPCPYNQRLLHIYRTDMWVGHVMRMIDDVDSVFYTVKDKALDFILSLIEGEGIYPLNDDVLAKPGWADPYLVSKYIVSNISPSMILDVIYKMLKKLMMAKLFETKSGFWKKIRKRVEVKRKKEKQIEENARIKTKKDIEVEFLKKLADDRMFSQFDNKLAVVTDEMMDCMKVDSYTSVLDLYKNNKEFSEHVIIKICLKLYSLLETLSRQSRGVKLFLETRKLKLSKFYGERVDQDDRAYNDKVLKEVLKLSSAKIGTELEENLIFFMFILKISKKIEISLSPHGVEKPMTKLIYFPLMPSTFFLEHKTKSDLKKVIDVENLRLDFQKRFKMFFVEMDQNYEFSTSSRFLHWICRNEAFYFQKIFCYIVGIAINVLIVTFYKLDENEELDSRDLIADSTPKFWIKLLSFSFAGYTFILFFFWLISRSYRQYKIRKEQFVMENPLEDYETLKNKVYIFIVMTVFDDESVQNFLLHFVFGILGAVFSPFWSTLHLLLLMNISRTAMYVWNASTAHLSQLVTTLTLAAFFIYSFSTFNAEFYSGAFDSDGVNGIDVCRTMRSCILYSINLGMRNGGGIADSHSMYDLEKNDWFKVVLKTFFDLLFFFVVNVISLNIVFGIIIDTFGEMRGSAQEREEKLNSCCMICMIPPSDFEENKVSFEHHEDVEHDIWLYPSFIKYLQSKPETEFTGDELEAWETYQSGSDDWMPLKTTHYLKNHGEEETIQEQVDGLKKGMKKFGEKLDIVGKNTLYIREVLKKMSEKVEVVIDELHVDEMEFEAEDSLDDLDLDISDE